MNHEEWLDFRSNYFLKNPVDPNHLRLDIELSYNRSKLSDVPVDFYAHKDNELFYVCHDWTPVTLPIEIYNGPHESPTMRMIVESSHGINENNIRLMSTSCRIVHEWWAARKNWVDFAFYDKRYWRITWNEYFGEWPGGKWMGLPFQDRSHIHINEFGAYESVNWE